MKRKLLVVTAALPTHATPHRPLVLIHGAANSANVWTYWQETLAQADRASYAIDLRGHGKSQQIDLSAARMEDYVEDVLSMSRQLHTRPVVVGWSMGGLVAMMVASQGAASACVALAPSAPARTRDDTIRPRAGEFGPDDYGITSRDPGDQPAMPDLNREEREVALASLNSESLYARDQRRRGIIIQEMPCPLLIVTGTEDTAWGRERYADLPIEADFRSIDGASHWGLVLSRLSVARCVPEVIAWLASALRE